MDWIGLELEDLIEGRETGSDLLLVIMMNDNDDNDDWTGLDWTGLGLYVMRAWIRRRRRRTIRNQ
ncbi:hypothetical protein CALCODRAFT_225103 [Calocera cornea HHB12733]|uniref:Uncharacterized protein n=1 Tax=Calocera cornea HHB12733 TaxID=1353952 RepID=A0A165H6H3_9BASI|nr:hypothetical protein CALCODRAFT_225103 [Calocera cornea HHB12733]